ncbi:hypothetical protein ACLOJK_002029 [Asimina triloba]
MDLPGRCLDPIDGSQRGSRPASQGKDGHDRSRQYCSVGHHRYKRGEMSKDSQWWDWGVRRGGIGGMGRISKDSRRDCFPTTVMMTVKEGKMTYDLAGRWVLVDECLRGWEVENILEELVASTRLGDGGQMGEELALVREQEVASAREQEAATLWRAELDNLRKLVDSLETRLKHLNGEDLLSLGIKELKQLERQVKTGVERIRSRKRCVLAEHISLLKGRVSKTLTSATTPFVHLASTGIVGIFGLRPKSSGEMLGCN